MNKINCKDCRRTCCDNVSVKLCYPEKKGIDPTSLKVGDWIYVSGITLVKKKNGLFRCRAFNTKTKLCRIWRYRPPLCREFFCKWTRKKKRKMPVNEGKRVYYLEFTTRFAELVKGQTTYFYKTTKKEL